MTPLRPGRATDLHCGVRAYHQESQIYRFGFVAFFGVTSPELLRAAFLEVFGERMLAAEEKRGLTLDGNPHGRIIWNRDGVLDGSAPKWLQWKHLIVAAFRFRFVDDSDACGCMAHETDHIIDAVEAWAGMAGSERLIGEPRAYFAGWLVEQLAHGAHVKIVTRKGVNTMACKKKKRK